tara:strand:- start:479 stop:928 length:450 start_codon:yes stop_codon:yes gene_type:complete
MAQVASIGAGYAPAYQLGGDPYFKTLTVAASGTAPTKVTFPYVTKFFQITNYTSGSHVFIGVTERGVTNGLDSGGKSGEFFTLSGANGVAGNGNMLPTTFGPMEIRTKRLFIVSGDAVAPSINVFAGLTTIPQKNMVFHTSSDGWDGVG